MLQANSIESRPLPALTSIRFFAAMLVVFAHVGMIPMTRYLPALARFIDSASTLLTFFYTLSGFVLAYNYAGRKLEFRSFYSSRFARIIPVYLLALLIGLPVFFLKFRTGEYPLGRFAASLLLVPPALQSWFPQTALAWNAPAWSISVECFFYLMFPLVAIVLNRLSNRQCLWIAAAMWPIALIPGILYAFLRPDGVFLLTGGHQERWIFEEMNGWLGVVNFNPLLRFPEFIGGVATGVIFSRTRLQPVRSARPYGWIAFVSLAAILLAARYLSEVIPYSVMHNGFTLPLWCVFMYTLAMHQFHGGRGVMANPALVLMGEASYAVYILQQPVSAYCKLAYLELTGIALKGGYPTMTLLTVYVVILCLIGVAVNKWFEKPARKLFSNWTMPGLAPARQMKHNLA